MYERYFIQLDKVSYLKNTSICFSRAWLLLKLEGIFKQLDKVSYFLKL